MKNLLLKLTDREAYRQFRRTKKLSELVRRLTERCQRSNKSFKAIVDLLQKYTSSEELEPIVKAISQK